VDVRVFALFLQRRGDLACVFFVKSGFHFFASRNLP
jgi:hypothetical protein